MEELTNDQVNQEADTGADIGQNDAPVYKTFQTKEEYQSNIDKIFNSRFRDYKETKEKYENVVNGLKHYFGAEDEEAALGMLSGKTEQQEKIQAVRNRLFSEAETIKEHDGAFDLQRLYDTNEKFRNELEKTGSVYKAYLALRSERKSRSFKESGSEPLSSGRVSSSPADLSDEDFDKYIKKIEGNL